MNLFKRTMVFVTTACFLSSTSFGQSTSIEQKVKNVKSEYTAVLDKAEKKGHVFQNSKGEKISASDILSGRYEKVYFTPENETRFKYIVTMNSETRKGTMSAVKADGTSLGRVMIKFDPALSANQNILNLQQAETSLNLMIQNVFASHSPLKSESRHPASFHKYSSILILVGMGILFGMGMRAAILVSKEDKICGLVVGGFMLFLGSIMVVMANEGGLVEAAKSK